MLGQFQSMYVAGTPSTIKIDYSGDVGIADTYPITAAILTGYLRPKLDSVNVVSAPALIKSHGIAYTEAKSAGGSDYAFEIGVTVTVDDVDHTVKGTLFEKTDPRICSIGGVRVNAKPEGHMFVCTNDDVPLILSQVCAKIGEAGVNIANLTLGRAEAGGRAMMVYNLDEPIETDVVEAIRALPSIIQAESVTFLTS
jgi:D-3-phosphoglycerate dehydrogenase